MRACESRTGHPAYDDAKPRAVVQAASTDSPCSHRRAYCRTPAALAVLLARHKYLHLWRPCYERRTQRLALQVVTEYCMSL